MKFSDQVIVDAVDAVERFREIALSPKLVAGGNRAAIELAIAESARQFAAADAPCVLSSAIAAMGLLLDSAPAVSGAMLLGPFITPLLAMSGALIQGWGTRLTDAALMVALGIALGIASATVMGFVFAPQLERTVLPPILLTLTRPGLLDLGIALAAGVAAGYATMRTEAAGALSGVAVSVTVEPLVSVDASTDGERATVNLDVTGPRRSEPAWRLAELLSEQRGQRVSVTLTFTRAQEDRVVSSG